MVGRQDELDKISHLLARPDVGIVTLTGPGGVGKTRLAVAIAHRLELSFPDGAYWVELAGVSAPADVGVTLTRALGVTPLQGDSTAETLHRYLGGKRMLVVVDNFEHVLDAAELIAELDRGCSELRFLITSREPLNLASEHQFRVFPLAVPIRSAAVTSRDIEAAPAGALFLLAARRRNDRFEVSSTAARAIAEICSRLDGLPLALELAAARTTVLGVSELATRLDGAVTDLGSGPRDAPSRQRTLVATLEWSYRMLDETQQEAFVRFAVFAGGATLDAAQAVTGSDIETLQALVAKSMVDRRHQPDGTARLVMLETVRHYARQQLAKGSDENDIHRRHLAHYLNLVEHSSAQLATHNERDALRMLDSEIDNVRAALRWALQRAPTEALRLAGHLGDYWLVRGDPDGLMWLDQALQTSGDQAPPGDRARAQLRRGTMLVGRLQYAAGRAAAQEALSLYEQTNDHAGEAKALIELAGRAWERGDREEGRAYAEAACQQAQIAGDERLLGTALGRLSWVLPKPERVAVLDEAVELLTRAGDHEELAGAYASAAYLALNEDSLSEAIDLLKSAKRAGDRIDRPFPTMIIYGNLGLAHLFTGEITAARQAFQEQLRLCQRHAFIYGAPEGLIGLAAVSVAEGQSERAAELLGAAVAMGYPEAEDRPIYDRLQRDYFAAARALTGDDAWQRAERAGALLSFEDAIAHALADPR
jgi:predicted ATPase